MKEKWKREGKGKKEVFQSKKGHKKSLKKKEELAELSLFRSYASRFDDDFCRKGKSLFKTQICVKIFIIFPNKVISDKYRVN